MSDESARPTVSLEGARVVVGDGWSDAARVLLPEELETDGEHLTPNALEEATHLVRDAPGQYAPTIVHLEDRKDNFERDSYATLAFVNLEDPDDVIFCFPNLDPEEFRSFREGDGPSAFGGEV